MDKKIFIKNRPFDVNDANDMQNWTEDGLKNTMKSIYSSGIVSGLSVTNTTNLGISIGLGTAFDNDYNFINVSTNQALTLSAANTNPRYDKIVISYLSNTADNVDTTNVYGMGTSFIYSQNKKDSFQIQIIKGTSAASPTVPATPAGTLPLAQVYIAANATSITAGNITDLRNYIVLNSNINKPVVVKSNTAPTDTTVLWIDTNTGINKPKIYVGSSWIVLNSEDANTLDGHDSTYFSISTHNHDTTYAKIGDAYTKTQSDTNYPTKVNNLSDLSNIATARTNLGLGSAATQNTTAFATSIHNHDGVYVKGDYILVVSSTQPTADAKTVWWDITNNLIKRYNGTVWVALNASDAQTVGGKTPGTSANNVLVLDSSGKVPNANINSSTTGGVGIVQLTDSTTSTSTTTAATPNSVKTAYDLANGKYSKPGTGIPKTDLETAVQTSLGKADTALQSAPVTSVNTKTGAVSLTAADVSAIPTSQKGTANGVASLGADGKVPASQLNIATTANAISITDSGNYYTGTNTETALQEIGQTLNNMRGNLVTTTNGILGM